MAAELRLDPELLRRHAASAAAIGEEIRSCAHPAHPVPGAAGEELCVALGRMTAEFAELSAALAGAAAAADSADADARQALRAVRQP